MRTWRNAWAINPRPSNWEYCGACDALYVGGERRTIRKQRMDGGKVVRTCPKCGGTEGWVDHYACYPDTLVRPIIRAATSEAACAECGKAWKRVIETDDPEGRLGKGYHDHKGDLEFGQRGVFPADGALRHYAKGFHPACSCKTDKPPVPCVVADIFAGSGTTVLVAQELGRTGIGIDLSMDYAKLARRRLERQESGLVEWVEEEVAGNGVQRSLFNV